MTSATAISVFSYCLDHEVFRAVRFNALAAGGPLLAGFKVQPQLQADCMPMVILHYGIVPQGANRQASS
jgi:hypothetical protein